MDIPIEQVQRLLAMVAKHLDAPQDKTRNRIILASKKRFLAEGFSGITIGELCHELKISKKTFYKHFDDKEDLVKGIVAENFKIFVPRMQELIVADGDPDEVLNKYVDFLLNVLTRHLSVAFLADMQTLIPEMWEAVDEVRRFHVRNLVKVFERGQKKGLFRQDVDPDILGRVLMLMLTRVIDPRVLYEAGLQIQDVIRIMFPVLRDGIYKRVEKEDGR